MMHRRDVLLGLAGLLAGCAQNTPTLAVAYHPWSGYAPLQLVRTLGWLGPDQFQVLDTGSASESVAALQAGRVQAAALTLDELLLSRAHGLPLQVVALLDLSVGADVLLGRAGMRSLHALKGARLGLETGTVGQLMTITALASVGLTPEEVTLVPLPFDRHEAAWRAHEIDALVTFEPTAGRLLGAGAVRLFDSRQLPNDLVIADVLAVRNDAMADQTEHLRQLVQALFRAQHHFHSLTLDAQYRLAPWLGLPPSQVLTAFKGVRVTNWAENRAQLVGQPAPLEQAAARLGQFMLEQGLVERAIPLDDLISTRYLPLEDAL